MIDETENPYNALFVKTNSLFDQTIDVFDKTVELVVRVNQNDQDIKTMLTTIEKNEALLKELIDFQIPNLHLIIARQRGRIDELEKIPNSTDKSIFGEFKKPF